MAQPHSPALLDLTTEQELKTIRIDAIEYPIKRSNDLTLAEYKRLERIAPRIAALIAADELTPDETKELSHLLDTTVRMALDAPADVQERLGDLNRTRIFEAFTTLLSLSLLTTRAELPSGANGSNGATSLGASAGTTAARRRSGGR